MANAYGGTLTAIEDQTFENNTQVFMDGHCFIRCSFQNCTMIFAGGDYAIQDCNVGVNIHRFIGPAKRTVDYLNQFNLDSKSFR